jgi:hypothetical protein
MHPVSLRELRDRFLLKHAGQRDGCLQFRAQLPSFALHGFAFMGGASYAETRGETLMRRQSIGTPSRLVASMTFATLWCLTVWSIVPHRRALTLRIPSNGKSRLKTVIVLAVRFQPMTRDAFREALLAVMDRKEHWAWPHFNAGKVSKALLHVHLEQEYATYVRDFPLLVGRAYVQCPLPEVRRELAANLYEEETGGLHAGRPHPDLFLEYPKGLGFDLARFEHVTLLPAARRYRAVLDFHTENRGWAVAAAVVTVFVEGTAQERAGLREPPVPVAPQPLTEHPLVKHYGLPLESLALTKAHRGVEGGHRLAAWKLMLDFVPEPEQVAVVNALADTLTAWLSYRDDVAQACGLARSMLAG